MSDFDEIARLAAMLEERAMQSLRTAKQEGDSIRARIAGIDEMRTRAREEACQLDARQLIGADALWQDWLLRERAGLRRQEAIARAREEQTRDVARDAFARREAAERLVAEERAGRRARVFKRDADVLDALGVLRNSDRD